MYFGEKVLYHQIRTWVKKKGRAIVALAPASAKGHQVGL